MTRRPPARFARTIGRLCVTATVVLAAATATRWIDSPDTMMVAISSTRWVLGLVAVLVLLLALASRHRWAIGLAVALVAVHAWIAIPAFIGTRAQPSAATVGILSSNLEYGGGDLNAIAKAAKTHQVNVIVLVEANDLSARLARSGLPNAYPYALNNYQAGGETVVLSQWPMKLVSLGTNTLFGEPLVRIQTPHGPLTVRAVHSASPPHPQWHSELTWLATAQRTIAGPIVMAGDFNASQDQPAFRRVLSVGGFTDAHRQIGAGWVRTWNARHLPFVQIDHVLFRDGAGAQPGHRLATVDAGTVFVSNTDHQAVWARIRMDG